MTDVRTENLKLCIEKIFRVKPGQELLVIADDMARSVTLAHDIVKLARSMGIVAVLAVMEPQEHHIMEGPRTISAAWKGADVVVTVAETSHISYCAAKAEASKAGKRYIAMIGDTDDIYRCLRQPISIEDLRKIKERTERLAEVFDKGSRVTVTTPHGTNLTFGIEGRKGRRVHPLNDTTHSAAPDLGEAGVCPLEGTTEGVAVIDSSIEGWNYLLPKPIRFLVKKGKIQVGTISSDIPEQAERLKKIATFDATASNFAAELGMGTSHLYKHLLGSVWDVTMMGVIHTAFGSNVAMGGPNMEGICSSGVHQDCLMTEATVKVDDILVMENGQLKV